MHKGNNPILIVALAAVIALAIGLAVWQYTRSSLRARFLRARTRSLCKGSQR